ncbi:coiled-coil domain-containing protein 126 [Megalops cyprinoides]|uniref:coiled-coil domain-containing protein 126 n=1 Tax=Megalops cyprinoides TaxID=118141 RepID=UPI001864E79F|nr:coiled-coil domain-containing protein 126 [Megalops cyprinoides]
MLGPLLRRNVLGKLSALLLLCGLVWGVLLMRYTFQRPQHQSSSQLRQQILDLSHRYVKVLTEENRNAAGPHGTSMAGYADLKRTIAVLLDDILQRLVKLEGKVDAVMNGSLTNSTHTVGGHPGPPSAILHRNHKQNTPHRRPETLPRPHPDTPHRRPETLPRPHPDTPHRHPEAPLQQAPERPGPGR